METIFKTKLGKQIAPKFFAVYHIKGGKTFRKIQDELDSYNFSEYDNVVKIELYENGTENLAPLQIDQLFNV